MSFENVFIGQSSMVIYKKLNCDWWKNRADPKIDIYVGFTNKKFMQSIFLRKLKLLKYLFIKF